LESNDTALKTAEIENLSAPGAEKFENPCALSNKFSSSKAVTIFSYIFRPTLALGTFEYGSKYKILVGTLTKCPLIK
jgi:hypothetical protein